MFVRLSQRRDRLQVQRRKSCNVGKLRGVLLVLLDAALALRHIAGEKDDDGVKFRTGQPTDPMIRVVGSRVSEDLRASIAPADPTT